MPNPLDAFSAPTREWFRGAFERPTAAQEGAWNAVASGAHALVVAPTGSGKTLSAFLWALDRLAMTSEPEDRNRRTRVLYVSPLKALAVDVERNLRAPLAGIAQTARRLEGAPATRRVSIGLRSGDTPAAERRRLATRPPDILITTPESLFLMLTSAVRESLQGVDTVIVDEVHAVAGSKRGAHLSLSLGRLDALLDRPAQRIGLSATVRPHEEVARFLGGDAPVRVVAPESPKSFDLSVVVPVEDMTELSAVALDDAGGPSPAEGSIWPHVEDRVVDLIERHRSTIVFANSRRLAERLTARLNEIHAARLGLEAPVPSVPAQAIGQSGQTRGLSTGPDAPAPAGGRPAPSAPSRAQPTASVSPDGSTITPRSRDAPDQGRAGGPQVLARSHHGSVSKEQRALIEDDLKSGRLPCVVATSSLELGIDMGAVDLVVQVEPPPSVASGLQRIGRAGHQVGEVSTGVVFPKHRTELLQTAVTVERMRAGKIEELAVPANPLDVLAQQTVAACALGPLDVDAWYATCRRTASFSSLPRSAYDATLDLLAGRYPSDEFAGLRPRVVWDRVAGTITGRPGAQRLAVTSGGTIPDRGLFGVFLAGSQSSARGGTRVGELDEEMVYESRVGDVFALGTTSWRIEDITHDRVLVSPAYGQPGRLPFWKGDSIGRPAELGRALGAYTREVAGGDEQGTRARGRAAGLDSWAVDNLLGLVAEQQEATGEVPNDAVLVVERFRDELGDWRVVLHSPFGLHVHAPWALAVGARVRDRYGLDGSAVASDDGVVVRLPDTDAEPPGAALFAFDAETIEDLVTREVGGSALFAARFRECAARALLLPRRDPGRRSPLWQQRQRSAQLLEVARNYPSFPIVLETVRECLQDVYDVPALTGLLQDVAAQRVRLVEVETPTPSPFARSLLFGYVAEFMYEGDAPLAERRAAALSLDSSLLAELLGRAELRDLLDPDVLARTERELQHRAPQTADAVDRRARDLEGLADLLRLVGPLREDEAAERCALGTAQAPQEGRRPDRESTVAGWLAELAASRRAVRVQVAGESRWAAVEDAGRLRDALGVPVPPGTPEAFAQPVDDPLGDLIGRYARTHGPFLAGDVADRLGLGVGVVRDTLHRLAQHGRVVEGEFRPGGTSAEWCDADVLRRLRRRSLAALRQEVEPVEPSALGRFLPAWQHVDGRLRGVDGVASVVEQLAGVAVPASALEPLVLRSRVRDYRPGMLDELTTAGEVLWSGSGTLPGNDGWVSLHLADSAPVTLPEPGEEPVGLSARVLEVLGSGGAYFFRQLGDAVGSEDDAELQAALWSLVWSGRIGNDTLAPLRALVGSGGAHHARQSRPRLHSRRRSGGYGRAALPSRAGPPTAAGRWSLLPARETDPTVAAMSRAELLLDRYGVVTRGAVAVEGVPGGFAGVYKVLGEFEDAGRCRRGHFVESLGAAQFSTGGAVDRLRSYAEVSGDPVVAVLAATDPANPYGAALDWPESSGGHRPGRKAGALVVLVDGRLVLYVERGGRTVLTFDADALVVQPAVDALALAVRDGAMSRLTIEKADGAPVLGAPLAELLEHSGFHATPRGLQVRSRVS